MAAIKIYFTACILISKRTQSQEELRHMVYGGTINSQLSIASMSIECDLGNKNNTKTNKVILSFFFETNLLKLLMTYQSPVLRCGRCTF